MRLFKKRVTPITLINNDEIYFIIQGGSGEGRISEPVSFDRLLKEEADLDAIPEAFQRQGNLVMVVPDYWLGNTLFPFQSRKRSLAEAFLERKLRAEFPEIPGVTDFFAYFFHFSEQGEPAVYAYFVREPTFFQLYQQLSQWGLQPQRITAPAFLWESQLKDRIPDFREGGKAFVHLLSNECFLYFFFKGHFLFSRQISLPEFQEDSSEQIDTLTYETNQSLYLFSQKAKAEIDKVYMVAFGHMDPGDLSERLGRDVQAVAGVDFDVRAGEFESLWVDVRVPAGTKPGLYRGALALDALNARPTTVPIEVRVRRFTIPERPSLRTAFGLGPHWRVPVFYVVKLLECRFMRMVDLNSTTRFSPLVIRAWILFSLLTALKALAAKDRP